MGARAWVAAFLVAVVAFVVYDASSVKTVSDSRWTLPAAVSLARHGDLDLEEYRPVVDAEGGYGVREGRGRLYNFFPYGTSVLLAPVVWPLAEGLEAEAQRGRVDEAEQTLASLVTALAVAVFFLVAYEVLGSLGPALLAAAVLAFGTAAWSTASRALWMHGPDMLLLGVALLLAVRSERRPVLAGLLGLPVALAVVVRPTSVAAAVCFGGWVLWQRRRQAPLFFALAGVVAVAFLAANHAMFHSWLHPYYDTGQMGESGSFLEALAGNLVSPARGLFVFCPVLLLAFWRRRSLTPLEWATVGTVVLHLLLVSRFQHWWGGFSFGPRFTADLAPLLVFLLLPFIGALRWRSAVGVAFGALLAASVFVHWRGATDFDTWLWNSDPVSVDAKPSRLWDWTDLQFLR